MDLQTTLIGLFIIASCLFPFVWVNIKNNNRKKQIINSLTDNPNIKITSYEFCGDMALGLNTDENLVFFYKKTKDQTTKESIRLADYKSCQLVKTTEMNTKSKHQVIQQLHLNFKSQHSQLPDVDFPLYNIKESMLIGGELFFGEKWANLLNQRF